MGLLRLAAPVSFCSCCLAQASGEARGSRTGSGKCRREPTCLQMRGEAHPSTKEKARIKLAQPISTLLTLACAVAASSPALAGDKISNEPARCRTGEPAILVTVEGIRSATGTVRIQSYRASRADWLERGQWLKRIEARARAGTMTFCIPVDAPGDYAVAVRHDRNGNGKTDITKDGGGMSNNPSISIWNFGKPSYKKVGVTVVSVTPITIRMKYL